MSNSNDLNDAAQRGKEKKGPKSLGSALQDQDRDEDRKPVRYTIDLPPGLHNRFKVQSAKESRSMKEVMIEAIEAYLAENE